ncbi:MAG TPA: DUF4296 domain-containing protein [Chitinophagaceae bacterium]|nr:DUF4296 domain-containing protein [Chitinophagaceae bacterium]
MRILAVTGLLMFLFLSCGSRKEKVLPPDKMQAVLWDLMRADKFLSDYVLNKDSSKKADTESVKLYRQVFALHQISGEEFSRSFTYYKDHPEQLKAIMDSINRPVAAPVAAPTAPVQPPVVPQQQSAADTVPVKADTLKPRIRKNMELQ